MAAQCETIGDDIASMDLFDEKGDVVKFGDLYGERKALVVFVRVSHVTKTSLRLIRLDCSIFCDTVLYVCKEYLEDLGRVPKENFEEADVRIVAVGCGPHKSIEGFRQRSGFQYDLYSDPERNVYQALGLNYTLSTKGEKSIHMKSSSFRGALSSTWLALKGMKLQGDFKQQGGAFIIAKGGQVLFSHLDEGTMDHTPINDLLEKAGVKQVDFNEIHAAMKAK